jgi:hypothetical protein
MSGIAADGDSPAGNIEDSMSSPSAAAVAPRRRKLGVGWWLMMFAFLAVALPLAAITAWSIGSARRANAALEELRESGEPADAAMLEAYYAAPPADQDATQLWIRASTPLDSKAFNDAAAKLPIVGQGPPIPPVGEDWPQLAEAEALLAQYADSLRLLHEAADLGGAARYPTKFSDGFAMLLPHAQRVRAGVRLLQLESHVLAHRGDPHGAARSIDAMFKSAKSLENEPILVSQLVRIACDAVARKQIETLLPQIEFVDDDLMLLQANVRAIEYQEGLKRALMGERAMGSLAFLDPNMTEVLGSDRPHPLTFVVRGDDLACYLKLMDRVIDTAELPWAQARRERLAIDEEFRAVTSGSIVSRAMHPLTALIMPSLNAACDAGARGDAQMRTADAALAFELYRRAHGELPRAWAQLVPAYLPETPVDPFDGRPVRFLRREGECVIYSIGADERDDHGQGGESNQPDIIFTLPAR